MSNKSSEKLKKWLDKLQQESWQLELILTGFAIFLILGLKSPIDQLFNSSLNIGLASDKFGILLIWMGAIRLIWYFIITNLVIHLFLRSFWIALIGLRYVSGDIDFKQLNLAPIFNDFLNKKVRGFDQYIERLEKICSAIFAFTFLIIFVIISSTLFLLILQTLSTFVFNPIEDAFGRSGEIISIIIQIALNLGALLYVIDFVTLGWLKSLNGFSKIYFPIYRLFGWLTLAPIYRPLYYNLVDNRFGRWVGLLILPYLILALVMSSVKVQYGKYFPKENTTYKLSTNRYDDTRDDSTEILNYLTSSSIPSKYVDRDFLEVFLPYVGSLDNPALEQVCPGIKPAQKEKILFGAGGAINIGIRKPLEYNVDSIMLCFQNIFRLSINDSTYTDQNWMLYTHPTREVNGFLCILDIGHLKKGRHELKIQRFSRNISESDSLMQVKWLKPDFIPFWKTTDKPTTKRLPPSDDG
ncbi:MAG: hypothetical protein Sapg2KO_00670 [Saprospiraceae bacterium]